MKKITNHIIEGKHQKSILLDVFFEETNQPKPILIFCHGYKGFKDWGAWNLMAEAFAKEGFFFIKFNFSHNGGTVEQPIDFPDLEAFGNNNYSKELDDLGSVIDWIYRNKTFQKEINSASISLMGHSRGGGTVLLKSNEDARVKQVITLSGVSDYGSRFPKKDNFKKWEEAGVFYVKNGRTHQEMPHYFQFYEDFQKNQKRFFIKRAVENLQIPHLILHGNNDTSVSISEAENLKKWQPKSKFQIIENANHVFNVSHPWNEKNMSKELTQVVDICVDFLK